MHISTLPDYTLKGKIICFEQKQYRVGRKTKWNGGNLCRLSFGSAHKSFQKYRDGACWVKRIRAVILLDIV